MPELTVPREPLLRMLTSAFDVPGNGLDALTARVRLLGRLGVPVRGRAEAHQRLGYGLREVLEVAMALALMNAHMPPALAARYVRERWASFARLAVDGLLQYAGASAELRARYSSSRPHAGLFIQGNVLEFLGLRGSGEGNEQVELSEVVLFHSFGEVAFTSFCPSAVIVGSAAFLPFLGGIWLNKKTSPPASQPAMLDRVLLDDSHSIMPPGTATPGGSCNPIVDFLANYGRSSDSEA